MLLLPISRMVLVAAIALISGATRRALPSSPRTAVQHARRRFSSMRMTDAAPSPQLLLVSSGLTSPALESSFRRMMQRASSAEAPPKIAMLVTAQMCSIGGGDGSGGGKKPKSAGDIRRKRWADARKKGRELQAQLGIDVECIDCAREDRPAELYREPLSTAECIWVAGGNTFFLWYWMRRSGVDEIIRRRVLEEGAVYVGQSAGAIVAGATIRTAFWKGWDDPNAAPQDADWSEEANLKGMGLVPDLACFPHFGGEWSALVQEKAPELGAGIRVACLTDDGEQSFVLGDETQT